MDVYIRKYLTEANSSISQAQECLRKARASTCSQPEDWPDIYKLSKELEQIKTKITEEMKK